MLKDQHRFLLVLRHVRIEDLNQLMGVPGPVRAPSVGFRSNNRLCLIQLLRDFKPGVS